MSVCAPRDGVARRRRGAWRLDRLPRRASRSRFRACKADSVSPAPTIDVSAIAGRQELSTVRASRSSCRRRRRSLALLHPGRRRHRRLVRDRFAASGEDAHFFSDAVVRPLRKRDCAKQQQQHTVQAWVQLHRSAAAEPRECRHALAAVHLAQPGDHASAGSVALRSYRHQHAHRHPGSLRHDVDDTSYAPRFPRGQHIVSVAGRARRSTAAASAK